MIYVHPGTSGRFCSQKWAASFERRHRFDTIAPIIAKITGWNYLLLFILPLAWIAQFLFWLLKYSERRCCQNKFWVNKSFTFCTFFAVLKVLWLQYEVLTCKLPLGQYCVKMHRFGGSTQAPMKTVKFSWDISLICKNVVESTRLKSTQTKKLNKCKRRKYPVKMTESYHF